MEFDYFFEDGHCISQEDFIQYAIWQFRELKEGGLLDEEIIRFMDEINWQKFATTFINRTKY